MRTARWRAATFSFGQVLGKIHGVSWNWSKADLERTAADRGALYEFAPLCAERAAFFALSQCTLPDEAPEHGPNVRLKSDGSRDIGPNLRLRGWVLRLTHHRRVCRGRLKRHRPSRTNRPTRRSADLFQPWHW